MTRGRVAWGIAALDIVTVLVSRLVDPSGDIGAIVIFTLGVASFAGVGALLDTRVPGNVIGRLLLAAGTLMSAAMTLGTYGSLGSMADPAWPLADPARTLGSTLFVYPFMVALIGVPLVFPDGRLPTRRFRWVVLITTICAIAWTVVGLFGPPQSGGPQDGIPIDGFAYALIGAVQMLFVITAIIAFGSGAAAIWLRFRRGDPIERQQVKWLAAIVGLGAVVLPVSFLVPNTGGDLAQILSSLVILSLFAIPIVIGIAVLRYRLYEIDRIISRTISWAVTTGVIVTVFAGIVVGLQGVLAQVTGGNTVAVAGSTLIVAALFQPLRRGVQRAVDRRFNRARYDSEQTLAAFGERVRAEVDLAALSDAVLATADEAVRPAAAGLWLRGAAE